MTATLQLALPGIDALADDLTEAEQAAAEAAAEQQDAHRAALARPARRCRCARPWGEPAEGRCVRCGHDRHDREENHRCG